MIRDSSFLILPSKETLFVLSLFPYLGFLWFISRVKQMPRLALFGFYCTLVFVAVTIPAGIYAQVHYGQTLANVDWLHGSAEFFLTLSNILIVLGFRQAVKGARGEGREFEKE
jgi:L-alanine-DL-glutamate epimerase-like enolase superfamily enzyme